MAAPSVTDYVLYGAYAGEGLAITIGNGLLLLTILLEKSLRKRKEMRIIAVLCIADLVYGFGGLLLNGYRILLMAFGLNTIPSTAWDCIKWPHSFLAQIGGQLTAFMNLAVSVDRLICVTFPVAYHKFGSRYATIFISAFFAYFFLSGATMLLSTYFQAPIFSKFNLLCVGAPFAAWYVLYHYTFIVVAGALDVIVYLGVFFSYRSNLKQSGPKGSQITDDKQARAQRRLTVTLGLITISTIIFYIIPFSIVATIFYLSISAPPITTIALAMLCRMSTIVNIFIYVYRQKEVRPGMWRILTCNLRKAKYVSPISGVASLAGASMMNSPKLFVKSRGAP